MAFNQVQKNPWGTADIQKGWTVPFQEEDGIQKT